MGQCGVTPEPVRTLWGSTRTSWDSVRWYEDQLGKCGAAPGPVGTGCQTTIGQMTAEPTTAVPGLNLRSFSSLNTQPKSNDGAKRAYIESIMFCEQQFEKYKNLLKGQCFQIFITVLTNSDPY